MAGTTGIDDKIMDDYGGRSRNLPQILMFDHVSPATRLLEKRRQMFEVQEALNGQKEEFGRREDAFRRREDGLRRKDLELQESLIKFNKFLQENESKRNRALKRTTEERKQRETKEQEIKRLESQLATKLEEERHLKAELAKNSKYQDYLENVSQTMSKYFPEISDILNRYKTLMDANKYLLEKSQAEESIYDNLQREYLTYRKAKENQILNDNNEIAELQVKFDQVKAKSARLQADVDQMTGDASEKVLLLGQVLSSTSNILDRCEENFRRRHNKPMIDRSSEKMSELSPHEQCLRTIGKLDEIANFLSDFRDIFVEYETEFGVGSAFLRGSSGVINNNSTVGNNSSAGPKSAAASTVLEGSPSKTMP